MCGERYLGYPPKTYQRFKVQILEGRPNIAGESASVLTGLISQFRWERNPFPLPNNMGL